MSTTQLETVKNSPKVLKYTKRLGYRDRVECKHTPKCDLNDPHAHCDYLGQAGAGWLERKANGEVTYHTPWTRKPKPFAMAEVKARRETAAKTYERLLKHVKTFEDELTKRYANVGACKGYVVAATNGHVALLGPGTVAGQAIKNGGMDLGDTKGYRKVVLDNQELQLAIKRALTMADARSYSVKLEVKNSVLTLSSRDPDIGDFEETFPLHSAVDFKVCFNAKEYLEPALGTWPLIMYVKPEGKGDFKGNVESAVVFEPLEGGWKYVVMPLRF